MQGHLGEELLIPMSRTRQLINAFLVIAAVMFGIIGLWAGRFLPEPLGSICARIFHILTTPIILEISFGILGILIVLALAHHHEKNADEWVEMDVPDETKAPEGRGESEP